MVFIILCLLTLGWAAWYATGRGAFDHFFVTTPTRNELLLKATRGVFRTTIEKLRKTLTTSLLTELGSQCLDFKTRIIADVQGAYDKEFGTYEDLERKSTEELEKLQAKLLIENLPSVVREIFFNAFAKLFAALPDYIAEPALFHARFPDAISNPKPINEFFHVFKREDKLFWSVYSDYTQQWYKAEAAVDAKFYERNSTRYFREIMPVEPFSSFHHAEVPITIPPQLRFEGVWIIAPPGRGKTTLLSKFLSVDLEKVSSGEASVILMDSKGDLIDHARRLKRFAPGGDLEGKLVLIEPTANLALNPLDLGASAGHRLALSEYILDGLLDMATTPKQGSVFRRALIAVQTIPGATFETFVKFLHDWKPYIDYVQTLPPDDRDFFLSGQFDGKEYRGTREELVWRIDGMMTKIPLVRSMLKAPSTKLDLGKAMDAGKVIIIDNSAAKLAAGTEFFSRFFVALILAAAQQRAGRKDEEKLPCYFYIDECDTVVARDTKIADILDRCRSQKIGLVLAHQRLKQIDNDKVLDAISNSAVRLANSDDDAPALSGKMRTTAEELRKLKRGQFALFMRDQTPRPLIINVPNEPVSTWLKMSDAQFAAVQQVMQRRYCYSALDIPMEATPTSGWNDEVGSGPEKWGQ